MLQKIAIVPLMIVALLVVLLLLLPALSKVPTTTTSHAYTPYHSTHVIADAGRINPDDFCKELNKALLLAGAKRRCFGSAFERLTDHVAIVRFVDVNNETMAQVEIGVDNSSLLGDYHLGLPEDKSVYTTSLRVFKDFEGQGLGTQIMRIHNTMLKILGAQPGDIHLLVASPDVNMVQAKQEAWTAFIKSLCAELHGIPVNTLHGGCWMIVE